MKKSWIPVAASLLAVASLTSCGAPPTAGPAGGVRSADTTAGAALDAGKAAKAARFGLLGSIEECPPTPTCLGYNLDGTATSESPTFSFSVRGIDNPAGDVGVIVVYIGTDIYVGGANFNVVRTGDGVLTDELQFDATVTNVADSGDVQGVGITYNALTGAFSVQFGALFTGSTVLVTRPTCDINDLPQ